MRTPADEKIWEREELWYKCKNKKDGIAITGLNGQEEGSDSRDIAYVCDEFGEYDMPTQQGAWKFPKCLPRRE